MKLKNKEIQLRAPDLSDLETIYYWENDPDLWHLSKTKIPFSRFDIEQFILNSNHDIFAEKQFRFMIDSFKMKKLVGCIDIYEFDPIEKRAGIGILIDKKYREMGIASQALKILLEYAKSTLHLHQVYCSVQAFNTKSLKLFEKMSFKQTGVKKDWVIRDGKFQDEIFLQRIF
jgi:diamine N-acetyltransferase